LGAGDMFADSHGNRLPSPLEIPLAHRVSHKRASDSTRTEFDRIHSFGTGEQATTLISEGLIPALYNLQDEILHLDRSGIASPSRTWPRNFSVLDHGFQPGFCVHTSIGTRCLTRSLKLVIRSHRGGEEVILIS
jgi:hypothetical protein